MNFKHGLNTRKITIEKKIYGVWSGMKHRCQNPKHKDYKDYGGRGITVCDEWSNDVMNFYRWAISNGYEEGLTLDRKDNNGNYNPENCKWETMQVNVQHRRSTKLNVEKVKEIKEMIKQGITHYVIAQKYNVRETVISRIKNNQRWSNVV
jgi:hypothetical protein